MLPGVLMLKHALQDIKNILLLRSPQIVRAFKSDGVDVEPFNFQPFEKFLKGKYFYRCKSNILFQKKFGWFEEKENKYAT